MHVLFLAARVDITNKKRNNNKFKPTGGKRPQTRGSNPAQRKRHDKEIFYNNITQHTTKTVCCPSKMKVALK